MTTKPYEAIRSLPNKERACATREEAKPCEAMRYEAIRSLPVVTTEPFAADGLEALRNTKSDEAMRSLSHSFADASSEAKAKPYEAMRSLSLRFNEAAGAETKRRDNILQIVRLFSQREGMKTESPLCLNTIASLSGFNDKASPDIASLIAAS
jgi:hypothetical protein